MASRWLPADLAGHPILHGFGYPSAQYWPSWLEPPIKVDKSIRMRLRFDSMTTATKNGCAGNGVALAMHPMWLKKPPPLGSRPSDRHLRLKARRTIGHCFLNLSEGARKTFAKVRLFREWLKGSFRQTRRSYPLIDAAMARLEHR